MTRCQKTQKKRQDISSLPLFSYVVQCYFQLFGISELLNKKTTLDQK